MHVRVLGRTRFLIDCACVSLSCSFIHKNDTISCLSRAREMMWNGLVLFAGFAQTKCNEMKWNNFSKLCDCVFCLQAIDMNMIHRNPIIIDLWDFIFISLFISYFALDFNTLNASRSASHRFYVCECVVASHSLRWHRKQTKRHDRNVIHLLSVAEAEVEIWVFRFLHSIAFVSFWLQF